MFDETHLAILIPAFIAGILVIATHVPLGQEVLKRGIIFIDLAIAQIAALGALIAVLLHWDGYPGVTQLAALTSAVLAGVLLQFTEKRWPRSQEAIIGTLFVMTASLAILLLANHPHGADHLQDLLAGQILWVSYPALIPVAVLYLAVLLCWFKLPAIWRQRGFYLLFAFAITASVQLVGVYLVFASLIIPALVTQGIGERRLAWSYGIGVVGYGLGLVASAHLDLPSGPTIVWALAIVGVCVAALQARVRARA